MQPVFPTTSASPKAKSQDFLSENNFEKALLELKQEKSIKYKIIESYLLLCAYFDPNNIDNEIICEALYLFDITQCIDVNSGKQIIKILQDHKLINFSGSESVFSIVSQHQEYLRKKTESNCLRYLELSALALYNYYCKYNNDVTRINHIITHAKNVGQYLEKNSHLQTESLLGQLQIYVVIINCYLSQTNKLTQVIEYCNKISNLKSPSSNFYNNMAIRCIYTTALAIEKVKPINETIIYFKIVVEMHEKFHAKAMEGDPKDIFKTLNITIIPEIIYSCHQLAIYYQQQEKLSDAVLWYEKEIGYINKKSPVDYVLLGRRWMALANMQRDKGDFEKAKESNKKAWDNFNINRKPSDLEKGNYKTDLACSYISLAQYKLLIGKEPKEDARKAIIWQKEALDSYKKQFKSPNPHVANAYCNSGLACVAYGEPQSALEYFKAGFDELDVFLKEPTARETAFITAIRIEINIGLGNAHRMMGKTTDALAVHIAAKKLIEKLAEQKKYLAFVYLELGQDYLLLEKTEDMSLHFNIAKTFFYEMNCDHPYIKIIEKKLRLWGNNEKQPNVTPSAEIISGMESYDCEEEEKVHFIFQPGKVPPRKLNNADIFLEGEEFVTIDLEDDTSSLGSSNISGRSSMSVVNSSTSSTPNNQNSPLFSPAKVIGTTFHIEQESKATNKPVMDKSKGTTVPFLQLSQH